MAALGAIHMILGATAFENEAETIVSTPRSHCDEPHDTAVANAAKTGSPPKRIEPEICIGLFFQRERYVVQTRMRMVLAAGGVAHF